MAIRACPPVSPSDQWNNFNINTIFLQILTKTVSLPLPAKYSIPVKKIRGLPYSLSSLGIIILEIGPSRRDGPNLNLIPEKV